jgi:hypothetical protein
MPLAFRTRTALTICAVVVTLAAVPASASPRGSLRDRAAKTFAFASDGSRYAAWQQASRSTVVVFDARTQRTRTLAVTDCGLVPDESEVTEEATPRARSGRFLLECGRNQAVLDVESGAVQPLPLEPDGYKWEEVGTHYAAGPTPACAYHRCVALVDIATGAMSVRHEPMVPDLDRPGAPSARVCRALRGRLVTELVAPSPASYVYADGLFAHDAKRHGYIEIDRCKRPPILIPGRGEPRDFDLRDGLLTWDTGHQVSTEPEESTHPSVLGAYELSSASRRTWQLPRLSVAEEPPGLRILGYSEHAGRSVFWIATRAVRLGKAGNSPEYSSVYAAPF